MDEPITMRDVLWGASVALAVAGVLTWYMVARWDETPIEAINTFTREVLGR